MLNTMGKIFRILACLEQISVSAVFVIIWLTIEPASMWISIFFYLTGVVMMSVPFFKIRAIYKCTTAFLFAALAILALAINPGQWGATFVSLLIACSISMMTSLMAHHMSKEGSRSSWT